MTLEEKILVLMRRYQRAGDGLFWTRNMIAEMLGEPQGYTAMMIKRLIADGKITRSEDGEIRLVRNPDGN